MPRGQDGVAAGSLETGDTRHVGTRAFYTCPPGYRLQGDREIVCRDDGGSHIELETKDKRRFAKISQLQ